LGDGEIPSLVTQRPEGHEEGDGNGEEEVGLASPEEARAFELWLRGRWVEKEERMKAFTRDQKFGDGDESEVVPIRQV
jgi:hypothetical protein